LVGASIARNASSLADGDPVVVQPLQKKPRLLTLKDAVGGVAKLRRK
jgi:hypothetical protein